MIGKQLLRDEEGAALIELALVATILTTLAAGVIDLSTAYSRKLALEQGAQRAIEKIMQTTGSRTVEDTLRNEAVCQVNGTDGDGQCKTSPITVDDVTVSYRLICRTTAGVEASNETRTDPDEFNALTCTAAAPVPNRFIQVAIQDTFTGIFVHKFAGGDGQHFVINAAAGMRTQ
jgi:Flp pilus assembly protein TadG